MPGLIIADNNPVTCRQIANLLIGEGYDVMVTDSVAKTIYGVLNKTAQIVLLGTTLDEFTSAELVPLLKKCNRDLMIILVADDTPLPLMRRVRQEGIFYHALRPVEPKDGEEIRQVVKCAMKTMMRTHYGSRNCTH
ncbi:MAG: response regulator [Thermodesulfobacteriota bacterium]